MYCLRCGADISHRSANARFCELCAEAKNRERALAHYYQRKAADPDKVKAEGRASYERAKRDHPERLQEYARRTREKNRERMRAHRQAYRREYKKTPKGRETMRRARASAYQRHRERMAIDPEYAETYRATMRPHWHDWKMKRKATLRGLLGVVSPGIRTALKAQQKGKCAFCTTRLNGNGHLDHIKPLAKGGLHEDSNLQVLCAVCNMSKGAKDPFEWAQSKGKLF